VPRRRSIASQHKAVAFQTAGKAFQLIAHPSAGQIDLGELAANDINADEGSAPLFRNIGPNFFRQIHVGFGSDRRVGRAANMHIGFGLSFCGTRLKPARSYHQ